MIARCFAWIVLLVVATATLPPPVAQPPAPPEPVGHWGAQPQKVLFGFLRVGSPTAAPAADARPLPEGLPRPPVAAERPLGACRVLRDVLAALLDLLATAGAALLALWHRVRGPAVLDHPTRARLLELVGRTPGLHLAALARELGIDRTTAEYHLLRLARGGMLVLTREGPLLRARLRGIDVVAAPTTRERMRTLVAERAWTRDELAAALGVTPQAVSHHARSMVRAGELAVWTRGGRRWYARLTTSA